MTEHITVSRELLRQALDFVDHMQYPQRLKDALRAALEQPAVDERAQFNAAIDFAIQQGTDADVFLNAWRHGDTSEWPEFQPPQAQPAVEPVQTLIAKLQADPDYAWSWHCNIAMAYVDAGGDPCTGNQGAARFMKMFANVDPAHELPAPRNHVTDGSACWCHPEVVYIDPDTGASVIVHKEPQ